MGCTGLGIGVLIISSCISRLPSTANSRTALVAGLVPFSRLPLAEKEQPSTRNRTTSTSFPEEYLKSSKHAFSQTRVTLVTQDNTHHITRLLSPCVSFKSSNGACNASKWEHLASPFQTAAAYPPFWGCHLCRSYITEDSDAKRCNVQIRESEIDPKALFLKDIQLYYPGPLVSGKLHNLAANY